MEPFEDEAEQLRAALARIILTPTATLQRREEIKAARRAARLREVVESAMGSLLAGEDNVALPAIPVDLAQTAAESFQAKGWSALVTRLANSDQGIVFVSSTSAGARMGVDGARAWVLDALSAQPREMAYFTDSAYEAQGLAPGQVKRTILSMIDAGVVEVGADRRLRMAQKAAVAKAVRKNVRKNRGRR